MTVEEVAVVDTAGGQGRGDEHVHWVTGVDAFVRVVPISDPSRLSRAYAYDER